MPALATAALSVEHQKVAGLVFCAVAAAVAVCVLVGWRRDAIRRRHGDGGGRGDPHHDPYADSPVPFDPGPAVCARCRAPLPDGARFCPGCGTEAEGSTG